MQGDVSLDPKIDWIVFQAYKLEVDHFEKELWLP